MFFLTHVSWTKLNSAFFRARLYKNLHELASKVDARILRASYHLMSGRNGFLSAKIQPCSLGTTPLSFLDDDCLAKTTLLRLSINKNVASLTCVSLIQYQLVSDVQTDGRKTDMWTYYNIAVQRRLAVKSEMNKCYRLQLYKCHIVEALLYRIKRNRESGFVCVCVYLPGQTMSKTTITRKKHFSLWPI